MLSNSWLLRAAGLLLLTAAFLAHGCNTPTSPNGGRGNPTLPETISAATLRAGDTLVITIQGVPDPSTHNVQVDEQGLITLPYIGAVTAAGSTAAGLSQQIRETYVSKKIYNTLDVSATVTERYVYVGGEVARPGRIIWTPDLTVATAIQAAGGFTLYAKETRVSLVRERNAFPINVALAQRNPSEDPRLLPGDAIQVPRSAF